MDEILREWYGVLALVVLDITALALIISFSYRWIFKRLLDCVISAISILFLAPMYAFIVIYACIEKGKGRLKSVLFHTNFVGQAGKTIALTQFCLTDENEQQHKYGAWMQRTKLYKLAMLFDVLLGRLSIVGVKPFMESDCVFLSDEEDQRMRVRPGLINPLALVGNEETDYDEMLLQDAWYVEKYHFFTDCKIFLVWLRKQIRGEGNGYLGKTREKAYAKSLLDDGRITQEDYQEALAEDK